MTSTFHEHIRKNLEENWDWSLENSIEPAIERFRSDKGKLNDSPFSSLYQAVLVWGPERVAVVTARVAPLIAPAMAVMSTKMAKSVVELGVASLANLLACCGYPDETAPVGAWLSEIPTSKDEEPFSWHWDRAFAALALDQRRLYRALGGVDPAEPLKLEPSRGFGGNLQGLLRHFGAAVEQRAGFVAVEPAWRDLVHNVYRHWQSDQLDNRTLFWIARVVHHRIAGAPLGNVARWLHEQITAS